MYIAPTLWLGTADSGDHLLVAMSQYAVMQAAGKFKMGEESYSLSRQDLGLAPMYHQQQGVGIVSISGSLVSGRSGFMALFDVNGYDDIREAVIEAINDPECKTILLHVSSGGGMVHGCEDLGAFLKMAGTIKPMTTYADGVMASAAYWLGSYGQHISTNQTSVLGSLGVVMVHMDKSEAIKGAGVTPTVIRSGKYKQIANSVEALSAEGKAELQSQCDTIYKVFIDAVSANRKVTYEDADQDMGQGREFLGKAAVKVGLADKLMTYEQALLYSKSLDNSSTRRDNSRKSTGASAMKVTLTSTQLAAFAAGTSLALMGIEPGAEITNLPTATLVAPEVHASVIGERDTFKAQVGTLTAEMSALQAQVDTLTAAASAAGTTLSTAQAAITGLTTERDSFKAAADKMLPIIQADVGAMSVALGGSADVAATLDMPAALAKHTELAESFQKRFPGGRVSVAAKDPKEHAPSASAGVSYLDLIPSGPRARKA